MLLTYLVSRRGTLVLFLEQTIFLLSQYLCTLFALHQNDDIVGKEDFTDWLTNSLMEQGLGLYYNGIGQDYQHLYYQQRVPFPLQKQSLFQNIAGLGLKLSEELHRCKSSCSWTASMYCKDLQRTTWGYQVACAAKILGFSPVTVRMVWSKILSEPVQTGCIHACI